jgi:hypothetical protein
MVAAAAMGNVYAENAVAIANVFAMVRIFWFDDARVSPILERPCRPTP